VYLDTRRSTKAAHWQLARWGERGQYCLRADMHLEGCIVKVQQIKRYFTRRWQLTTNFVVKRIKFYVWTADAGGSFLGKVNKSSSHDCIYVTTWLTPSKNRRSGQRSFTAVPQTDAIVIAPKIFAPKIYLIAGVSSRKCINLRQNYYAKKIYLIAGASSRKCINFLLAANATMP